MLLTIIVVCVLAAIAIAIVRSIPGISPPFNWLIPVLILLVAFVVIAERAGLLSGAGL